MTLTEWAQSMEIVGGAATGLAALVAIFALWYAHRQWDEAKTARQERNQPFVTVSLVPSHGVICNIVIRNESSTLARNVTFSFEPEFESAHDTEAKFRKSAVWTRGIPTLVPEQEIRITADVFYKRFKRDDLPKSHEVSVKFEDSQGNRYSLMYTLDFEIFYGYSTVDVYGVHEIANAMRDMKRIMSRWDDFRGGLKVVARDGDARDARDLKEEAESRAEWQERRRQAAEAAAVQDDAPSQDDVPTTTAESVNGWVTPVSRPVPASRPVGAADDATVPDPPDEDAPQ